jgi:putative ABC transport system permease protein
MYTGLAFATIRLGLKNIRLHKLRSLLTTLGIICGVAAVICMLSISEGGAEAEMALIRLLGTHNIIIRSVKPAETGAISEKQSWGLEYGLTRADLAVIRETAPHVERIVPLREVANEARYGAIRHSAAIVGADPAFFRILQAPVAQGRPLEAIDETEKANVCVIGDEVRNKLFAFEDPIGQSITVSRRWAATVPFTVVGVLSRIETAGSPARGVGDRDLNADVFIPFATADARYGDASVKRRSGTFELTRCVFSDLYVQVDSLENVIPVSEMLRQTLSRLHTKTDYLVKVPLEQLRIAEDIKRRRQITLGCIAGISLLVGGIGIMNIMLATVTERTHEIGIRRALGAKRRHITMQFLIEALILSSVGGLMGVLCGSASALAITHWVGWPTVIHQWTILVSLGLALAVGVFFGIYPAAAASRLDPIDALRHS